MHSSHYRTTTIHHHGDYGYEYLISDVRRNKEGENLSGVNCTTLRISEKKFDKIVKELISKNTFKLSNKLDYKLTGQNADSETKSIKSITLNSGEMVYFYIDKLRIREMEDLEKMSFKKLLKRYSHGA